MFEIVKANLPYLLLQTKQRNEGTRYQSAVTSVRQRSRSPSPYVNVACSTPHLSVTNYTPMPERQRRVSKSSQPSSHKSSQNSRKYSLDSLGLVTENGLDYNQNMSVTELPPLPSRPQSSLSKRSSNNSLSDLAKGTAYKYHEKPSLISVDSGFERLSGSRTQVSPGSTGSSSHSRSRGSPVVQGMKRTKSWCVTDRSSSMMPEPIPEASLEDRLRNIEPNNNIPAIKARTSNKATTLSNPPLTASSRTKSQSNLFSKTTENKTKNGLARYSSEQSLNQTGNLGNLTQRSVAGGSKKAATTAKPARSSLRQSASQPNFRVEENNIKQREATDTEKTVSKSKYIMDWLLGLEEAERPDTPLDIKDDPPQQTDTAIHIVHEEN